MSPCLSRWVGRSRITVLGDWASPCLRRQVQRCTCANWPLTLDLAGAGLLVKALGVTALALLDAGIDKDLDERKRRLVLGVQLSGQITVGSVGANKRGDRQG